MKRANKASSKYEEFRNYYIPRKVKRFSQIDGRKLLAKAENDQKQFSIVHSKEEYKEKSSEMNRVHYLQVQEGTKSNHLLWKKSNGPI
ncbi:MAG: hypothetical protein ACK56I_13335, partial [bacterium]